MGRAAINSYFSDSMLPWIVGEIELNRRLQNITMCLTAHCIDLKRDFVSRIPSSSGNSITSPDGLESLSEDLINFDDLDMIEETEYKSALNGVAMPDAAMELILEIHYSRILHTRVIDLKQSSYFILVIQEDDRPIYCHAFKSDLNVLNVINIDIETRIKVERQSGMPCIFKKPAKGSEHPSDNDCVRFEVLLVGVVNLKNPDPAHTLIDQAVAEFEERYKQLGETKAKSFGAGAEIVHTPVSPGFIDSGSPNCMIDDSRESSIDVMRQMRQRCSSIGHGNSERPAPRRRQRHCSEPSVLGGDTRKTRIRLFQIGHSSVKMVCPNKTVRTCEIEFASISRCMQGIKHREHFGMIANTETNVAKTSQQSHSKQSGPHKKLSCFVFQCSDENICEEIMQGIRQAFATSFNDASPMDEFDTLCKEMNSVSMEEASLIIGRKMKELSENEVSMLKAQVVEINPKNRQDRLSALMAALRRLYEIKHIKHSDDSKSAEDLNVNNGAGSPTSKFDNIKSKAITSFGSLIQKGKKKMLELHLDTDHFSDKLATSPVHKIKHFADGFSTSAPSTPQKANLVFGTPPQNVTKGVNRSRSRSLGKKLDLSNGGKNDIPLLFYHKIFYGITNTGPLGSSTATLTYTYSAPHKRPKQSLDTAEDIRKAWKWAIGYQILLNKINAISSPQPIQVSATSESYEYSELSQISDQVEDIWMELFRISLEDKENIDQKVLHAAVKKGVLNNYRGRIWKLLQSQCHRVADSDDQFDMSGYQKLLDNLTPYQHAILIDIGRTFPTHPMYRQLLGPGQLSLFNVLKAYSLFDKDVGYCQGLSFIAGVLLMHTCIEDEAYKLLYCIMHEIGCRSMYLPDMKGMKLAMYKMTRLLHDKENDVFKFFQKHEITMMLVATPWFLTMFASTFPMGFVARVFDIVFVDGMSAIFKVALCLITKHKDMLLQLDDFEDLVNYIKNDVPQSDSQTLMEVIDSAMTMSIESKLEEYETEYRIISEELPLINYFQESKRQMEDQIHCLENVNTKVTESNCELLQQLQDAQQKIASLQKQLKNTTKH